mgnify:CR=1 FL=1
MPVQNILTVPNGEVLYNAVGCAGCHQIAPSKSDLPDEKSRYTLLAEQGPNLINLGSKTTSEWVYKWIKDPTSYWPDTKMPNLRLTNQETRDITSYLLSFSNEEFEDIEILRFFDLDVPIKMVETSGSSLSVDVIEDVEKVEKELIKLEGKAKI